jgi:hypothetical protein
MRSTKRRKSYRCPFHEDKHDSFSVWQRSDGAWFWKCHSGCGAGDEINFLELHRRIPRGDATNIDGINQGQTQDEYSVNDGIPHYSIRDLGTVTFFSGGNKAFTFLVAGKNATSSRYSVAFDYIELELTNRRETESLPIQAKSAAPHAVFVNANMSGGAGTLLGPNSLGDFVTYKVGVTKVGTYKVQVRTKTLNNRGIFQLSINGVNQGLPQDEYTSTVGYGIHDLGTVTFTTTGNKAFKFLVTGRNASSTGYWLAFDSIALIPTNRRETESLVVAAKSLSTHSVFTNVNMSNGAGTLFGNNKVGDYVTYAVPVTKAGTYKVRVGIRTLSNRGIFSSPLTE